MPTLLRPAKLVQTRRMRALVRTQALEQAEPPSAEVARALAEQAARPVRLFRQTLLQARKVRLPAAVRQQTLVTAPSGPGPLLPELVVLAGRAEAVRTLGEPAARRAQARFEQRLYRKR